MNLKTLINMKETFNVPVGLSDHSLGSISAIIAVALGACVVEKHLCISRTIPNPDSSFSMEPEEFKQMVSDIRTTEKALGHVSYEVSESEVQNKIFRKSIFVVQDMNAGEAFSSKNVRIIRPANGLPPKYITDILGKKASRKIEKGTPFSWDLI